MRLIRVARLVLDIPVHTLASEAKLSVREVHRLERGEVQPRPATLLALDAAFATILARRLQTTEGR